MTGRTYAPDFAAVGSAASAGITYVAQLNDVLQLVATVVAIVAGLYAIKWHRVRIEEINRNALKENEDESKREGTRETP